jgi:hypothetical protein
MKDVLSLIETKKPVTLVRNKNALLKSNLFIVERKSMMTEYGHRSVCSFKQRYTGTVGITRLQCTRIELENQNSVMIADIISYELSI